MLCCEATEPALLSQEGGEGVPGGKSLGTGPQTTSFSFVPFTSTVFPLREHLREVKGKRSVHSGAEDPKEKL